MRFLAIWALLARLREKWGGGACPFVSPPCALWSLLNNRLLNFTEIASVQSTTADIDNQHNNWPARLLNLDLYNMWYRSHNELRVKTFTIELTAQFNIVMMYIYALDLRQFEVKLGKCSRILLFCQELPF